MSSVTTENTIEVYPHNRPLDDLVNTNSDLWKDLKCPKFIMSSKAVQNLVHNNQIYLSRNHRVQFHPNEMCTISCYE